MHTLTQIVQNALTARLMIYPGELVRVPVSGQSVRVVAGKAWVSVAGRDHVLCAKERLTLPDRGDDALISGNGPNTIVEVTR